MSVLRNGETPLRSSRADHHTFQGCSHVGYMASLPSTTLFWIVCSGDTSGFGFWSIFEVATSGPVWETGRRCVFARLFILIYHVHRSCVTHDNPKKTPLGPHWNPIGSPLESGHRPKAYLQLLYGFYLINSSETFTSKSCGLHELLGRWNCVKSV